MSRLSVELMGNNKLDKSRVLPHRLDNEDMWI